jgi:DNA modification methylase
VPLVGQVYGTDRATLIQGDCLDVLPELDSGSIDSVITDPPYGVDYRGRWGSKQKRIINDSSNWWIPALANEIFRLLPSSGFVICFYGWAAAGVFLDAFNNAGFRPTSHLIFVKNVWGLGYHTRGKHEQAYLFTKGKAKPQIVGADVLPWTRVQNRIHPTQKPACIKTRRNVSWALRLTLPTVPLPRSVLPRLSYPVSSKRRLDVSA